MMKFTRYLIYTTIKPSRNHSNPNAPTQHWYVGKGGWCISPNEANFEAFVRAYGYKTKAALAQGLKAHDKCAKEEEELGFWHHDAPIVKEFEV